MKQKLLCTFVATLCVFFLAAQEDDQDYIQFDDRRNTVHGVYLGFTMHYGELDGKNTYLAGGKLAYVANQQLEIGFAGVGFFSEQELQAFPSDGDLYGGYGGLHLEPYLLGKSKINISIPLLIGAGGAGFSNNSLPDLIEFGDGRVRDWDAFFIAEPGLNFLYNVSRFVQLEVGMRYRFTSKVDFAPGAFDNLNGFSAGVGVKIGVFNLGRNKRS